MVAFEQHALVGEPRALFTILRRAVREGDATACAQHAMPRHALFVIEELQRAADQPRAPWKPGEICDLPIGRDATVRNGAHRPPDALISLEGAHADMLRPIGATSGHA